MIILAVSENAQIDFTRASSARPGMLWAYVPESTYPADIWKGTFGMYVSLEYVLACA